MQYRKRLSRYPRYYESIEEVIGELEPADDTRLYLYTFVPALAEYVRWVLDEAYNSGKKRLYFLSRDGYQMYIIARAMATAGHMPVECRYLEVSRRSIRVPEYCLDLEKSLDKLCVGGIDVTLDKVLGRALLTEGQISEVAAGIGWQDRRKDILNYRQLCGLKRLLKDNKKLYEYIYDNSVREYDNAMGYLRQEGLLEHVPYALVDSGWTGTLQASVEALVHSEDRTIGIEGYYFGLYEVPGYAERSKYHGFYFGPETGIRRKAYFSNSLFESVCTSDRNMTEKYEKRHDGLCEKYYPRYADGNMANTVQIRKNTDALVSFLSKWNPGQTYGGREGIRLVWHLLAPFMSYPDTFEVDMYGGNYFTDDIIEDDRPHDVRDVAARLTAEQIREQRLPGRILIIAGIKNGRIRESAWIEGSIARNGKHRKSGLFHARLYKYFIYARKGMRAVGRRWGHGR